jgi:hypothetical protein
MKKITLLFLLSLFFSNAQEVLNEDFEGGIPLTWSNENLNSLGDPNEIWTIDNTGLAYYVSTTAQYMYTAAGMSGNYAIFNSDAYGDGPAEDAALTSPAFDCSGLSTVVLSFNEWFTGGYGGAAYVEVSADGGSTWTAVVNYPTTNTDLEYGEQIIDITSIVGTSANAHVRFRYTGDFSYYYAIDNVVVQQPQVSAPGACTTPTPTDQATDVTINTYATNGTTYKWVEVGFAAATTGDPASTFDVTYSLNQDLSDPVLIATDYNGTIPENGSLWGTEASTGWQANTTYYWKVTANNIAGSTDSETWSFTTGAEPLSIDDYETKVFKAFPNPVADMLTIQGNLPIEQVEVFNQLGQSILTVKENALQNNQIDLGRLNSGVYFVEITSETKTETLRVVKK